MARKTLSILSLLLLVFTAFAAEDTYQIVMLGDLHYDNEACREPSSIPALSDARKREMKRNLRCWREGGESLKLLEQAGKAADELHSPFAIQIGDFCQGDAGSEKMAEKMILECMATCKKYIHVPFIAAKGNHDPRGKGANDALNRTLPAFWSKELGLNPPVTRTTFAHRQGPDVFIFLDDITLAVQKNETVDGVVKVTYPNMEYFESLLNEHKDVRYTFIVCHLPIIPTGAGRWIPFGNPKFDVERKALLKLLCKRNAIVLCGHIHGNTFMEFTDEAGTVSQVTSISLFSSSNSAKMGKPSSDAAEQYLTRKNVAETIAKDKEMADYLAFYMAGLKRFIAFNGAGYCIVRVSPDGVVTDFRSILDPEYCTSIKMR